MGWHNLSWTLGTVSVFLRSLNKKNRKRDAYAHLGRGQKERAGGTELSQPLTRMGKTEGLAIDN